MITYQFGNILRAPGINGIRYLSLLTPLAVVIGGYFPGSVAAEELSNVVIYGEGYDNRSSLSAEEMLNRKGTYFSAAGGVSALPILNGMMSDRVKVQVDGAEISAACGNEMNPPLSYVSASQIVQADVVAGLSPVSMGGDNIAGVISISTINPHFSDSDSLSWQQGYVAGGFKSNSHTKTVATGAEVASRSVSVKYDGAWETADSYFDGNGDKVADTLYEAQNHALTAAYKDDKQLFAAKLSYQYIPYQGFPNQYMDMTDNTAYGVNTQYVRQFSNGELEARVNWHGVEHEMGFFSAEKSGTMPMETDGDDYSYQLHWTQLLGAGTQLQVGHEYFRFVLDDRWPAVPGSMMMGPQTYVNLNNAMRERIAVFAEMDQQLGTLWSLNYGVRYEQVNTDADEVSSYGSASMMMAADNAAADSFNAADRNKSDDLIDATVMATLQLSEQQKLQFGLAQKSRAPNLYERYSWGQTNMATTMIGWNGDGNGYIGDIDLKPEVAHTLSARYQLQTSDGTLQASVQPFYTDVDNYIDVDVAGTVASSGRNKLQFSNVDATLYGLDAGLAILLTDSAAAGQWQLDSRFNYTHGKRDDDKEPLYQLMPFNATLALSQQWGNVKNTLSWQWVDKKGRVNSDRLENETASYHLVDFSSQWQLQPVTLTASVTNLFDRAYELPLGGVSVADYRADNTLGFAQLMGQGRSFNLNARYDF